MNQQDQGLHIKEKHMFIIICLACFMFGILCAFLIAAIMDYMMMKNLESAFYNNFPVPDYHFKQ